MKKRSLLFYSLCFTLLLTFIFQSETDAESNKVYEVGTSNLNLRSSPSHDAPIVGKLQLGQQVTAFNEKNGWVQTYYSGDVAWVASQYLKATEQKAASPTGNDEQEKINITASGVNVRSGPGTGYSVTGSTTSGDTHNLLETSGDWVKVSLANGSGWVSAEFTSHVQVASSESNKSSNSTTNESNVNQKKTTNGSLSGQTIVLDPGHGGKDPGSIGFNNVHEKDLINPTSDKIAQQLRNAGANVILTRSQDSYISLEERIRISNAYRTDAFISIHYNAFPVPIVRGVSTYYYSGGEDKNLAQHIQSSLADVTSVYDRGIQRGDYKVLRDNKDLAVLIELGFITNPDELQTTQTAEFQNKAAEAITNGLINYFAE